MTFFIKKLLWTIYSFCYDVILFSIPHREMFEEILSRLRDEKASSVLDVGAGTGNLEYLGRRSKVKFTATDFSSSMLAFLRIKNPDRVRVRTLRWDINSDFQYLSVGKVDAVVCVNVIFTVKNLDTFLGSTADALNEGGVIFIVSPNENFSIREIVYEHIRQQRVRRNGQLLLFCQLALLIIPLLLLLLINLLLEILFSKKEYRYYSESEVASKLRAMGFAVTSTRVLAGQEYMVIGRK